MDTLFAPALAQLSTKSSKLAAAEYASDAPRRRAKLKAYEAAREARKPLEAEARKRLPAALKTASGMLRRTAAFKDFIAFTASCRVAKEKMLALAADEGATLEQCRAMFEEHNALDMRRDAMQRAIAREPAFAALSAAFRDSGDVTAAGRWLEKWLAKYF